MKWLLLAVVVGLVVGRRALLGDLLEALRAAPRQAREGYARAQDPLEQAREVGRPRNP